MEKKLNCYEKCVLSYALYLIRASLTEWTLINFTECKESCDLPIDGGKERSRALSLRTADQTALTHLPKDRCQSACRQGSRWDPYLCPCHRGRQGPVRRRPQPPLLRVEPSPKGGRCRRARVRFPAIRCPERPEGLAAVGGGAGPRARPPRKDPEARQHQQSRRLLQN